MRLGGVEEGSMNEQLQQQVTGKRRVRGLNFPSTATPITTGIIMVAQAVLDTKMPMTTMIMEISVTARY